MTYQKEGPTIRSLDRSDAEPIRILVPDRLYSNYYRIYLRNNDVTDLKKFVAQKLDEAA